MMCECGLRIGHDLFSTHTDKNKKGSSGEKNMALVRLEDKTLVASSVLPWLALNLFFKLLC